jgi:uncharacterized protein YqgC (DUF456 family)
MVDLITIGAVCLAAIGVAGALLPLLPGPLLSVGAVVLYWWGTGYTDPGPVVLGGFLLVGIVALVADVLGGAVGASLGGGGRWAMVLAAIAGLVLIPVAGPFGVLLGVAGVTFVVAYRETADVSAGVRAAAGATLGLLASVLVQFVLTLGMFFALVVVILL